MNNFHNVFEGIFYSTLFSAELYFIPLIICLSTLIWYFIKIIHEYKGTLYFRELIFFLSLLFLSLFPLFNTAIAICILGVLFYKGVIRFFNFLDKFDKKVIFEFYIKDKS